VLHHETRELPAYVLVIGKGRLKLVDSGAPEKNGVVVNEGHREMKALGMDLLARMASQTLRTPVLDQTGLTGYYDFPYDFSMEEMGGLTSQTAASDRPSIFTIMENLGLKLESRKAPFDVVVIDRGNPTPPAN
jgi:uncharacterized protein (TIGR03435 family)